MTVTLSPSTVAKLKKIFGDDESAIENFVGGVAQYVNDNGFDAALKNISEQQRIINAQLSIALDIAKNSKRSDS